MTEGKELQQICVEQTTKSNLIAVINNLAKDVDYDVACYKTKNHKDRFGYKEDMMTRVKDEYIMTNKSLYRIYPDYQLVGTDISAAAFLERFHMVTFYEKPKQGITTKDAKGNWVTI